jgi:hypothetical protein
MRFGLRAQIQVLGMAGVAVVGTIYLLGLEIEQRSARTADQFTTLASLTAKVSEAMLQARELATSFLRKPNDKKLSEHNASLAAVADHIPQIERFIQDLPDGDPMRRPARSGRLSTITRRGFPMLHRLRSCSASTRTMACRASCAPPSTLSSRS